MALTSAVSKTTKTFQILPIAHHRAWCLTAKSTSGALPNKNNLSDRVPCLQITPISAQKLQAQSQGQMKSVPRAQVLLVPHDNFCLPRAAVFCMHYAKLPIRNHPINDSLQRRVSYTVITFLILKYHRKGFTFFDLVAHVLLTWHYTYKTFEVATGTRFTRTTKYLHPQADIKRFDNTFLTCVFASYTSRWMGPALNAASNPDTV